MVCRTTFFECGKPLATLLVKYRSHPLLVFYNTVLFVYINNVFDMVLYHDAMKK